MFNNNHGFTLIELLISIALTAILSAVLISLLQLSKNNYAKFQAQQQIYQQARQVEMIFDEAISHAGYAGCKSFERQAVISHLFAGSLYDTGRAIEGYAAVDNGSWQPALPRYLDIKPKPLTDVLVLRYLSPQNSLLQTNMVAFDSPIKLTKRITGHLNDVALISDCQHADLFYVQNESDSQFFHPNFNYLYQSNARFGLWNTEIYFIKATTRRYFNNTPIYALYRDDGQHAVEELVPGIEEFRLTFSTAGNQFVPASQVKDWLALTKIQINFVSRAQFQQKFLNESFEIIFRVRNR